MTDEGAISTVKEVSESVREVARNVRDLWRKADSTARRPKLFVTWSGKLL